MERDPGNSTCPEFKKKKKQMLEAALFQAAAVPFHISKGRH